jgi:putative SOS response-associated peptidase YedK
MSPIHNRMPVILPQNAYAQWIDSAVRTPDSLNPLIKPYPAKEMAAYPVSTLVNNPKNDQAACVVPA